MGGSGSQIATFDSRSPARLSPVRYRFPSALLRADFLALRALFDVLLRACFISLFIARDVRMGHYLTRSLSLSRESIKSPENIVDVEFDLCEIPATPRFRSVSGRNKKCVHIETENN